MIIILGVIILLVTGILVFKFSRNFAGFGFVLMVAGFVLLFITMIAFPCTHYETMNFIAEVQAMQETLSSARENGTEYENALILKDVMEINRDLASLKYYNSTVLGLWIPDAIMEIELIK